MSAYPYYYAWIEGLEPRTGEKLSRFDSFEVNDRDYTLLLTKALRVRARDMPEFKEALAKCGIAKWVHENPNTYVGTNYAPTGTIWKPF